MKKHFYTSFTFLLAMIMIFSSFAAVYVSAGSMNPFTDVAEDSYYFDAVMWAYANGITTGTTATKFAPDDTCTRGQVVTFLWRALGEPEPVTKENRFNDVKDTDYYYKPVLWAVENGITNGTSEKMFSPAVTCTNAHILTFIWRALGEEGRTGEGEWYDDAVNWAAESGMLKGTFTGTFVPSGKCPRANVVTYLYRYLESGRLTVYVSSDADASVADGSPEKPFATIEAARDYIRTVDKSAYSGINVRVKSGNYSLKAPVALSKEDSGTESCPIRYIGEKGAYITGGATIPVSSFVPADGETAKYFSSEAKANIVMTDLKPYGITKEEVAEKYAQDDITYSTLIPLYIDGKLATIARYPNESYDAITGGAIIEVKPGATDVYERFRTTVTVSDETAARMAGWHDLSSVFTLSCHIVLWRTSNYRIMSADGNTLYMTYGRDWYNEAVPAAYTPLGGRPIVFENIPEELDMPGEYYVDRDAVLYVYKTENFDKVHISLPLSEKAFDINGADYISIENFIIESFADRALTVKANNFGLKNCEVRGIGQSAIDITGNNVSVTGCDLHDISFTVLTIDGGDCGTLTSSGNIVSNNAFHEWGQVNPFYSPAVNLKGCGTVVSHNEMYNAGHEAITWEGNYHIVEYNEIYDVCNISDDCGAIYSYNSYAHYGNVFRYNYIHDIGCRDEFLANIDGYTYCGTSAIYWDNGKSGQTAEYNIFENINGAGVIASGRDETVTNNLFISCGWGVTMPATWWQNPFLYGAEPSSWSGQGLFMKEDNEIWKAAFPFLYEYNWTNHDMNDPNYFGAPAGNVMKNNYYYFDKSNVRSQALYGHVFQNDIPDCIYKFSGDTIEDAVEGVNMKKYTSKRLHITAADVIEETSSITGITLEEFNKIGRK